MILTDRQKDNDKETTSLTFFGGLCTESCLNTMVAFLATGHSWLRFPLSVVSPHFCKHTDSCRVIALILLHIFKLVHHSYLTLNKDSCRVIALILLHIFKLVQPSYLAYFLSYLLTRLFTCFSTFLHTHRELTIYHSCFIQLSPKR